MEHTHDAQGCETARVATLKDATNLVRLLAPDDEDKGTSSDISRCLGEREGIEGGGAMTNMQMFCIGLFLGCSFTAAVMLFIGLLREMRIERRWLAGRQK